MSERKMNKLLFFVLAFSIHYTANAADSFSTLEERMSGKEFQETGIVKLTEAELAALNDWLRRHSVATLENAVVHSASGEAQTGATKDLRGFENQPKNDPNGLDGKLIHSTIAGTFDGWNGKETLFKLTNGMVWQQTEKDTFYINPVENAAVTIRKGFMGNWKLSIDGHSSNVRVSRIQ
jgi:hypothetical protein